MFGRYSDILSRIDEAPSWFDDYGVPRFGAFTPGLVTNIHAREIAFIAITCQVCQQPFNVAMTGPHASRQPADAAGPLRLRDHIAARSLHFGDPPNIGCCDAGPSMNSVPRKVLEYWNKPILLGHGQGSVWPRGQTKDGRVREPRSNILDAGYAMTLRRDATFEGVDLTPDRAR